MRQFLTGIAAALIIGVVSCGVEQDSSSSASTWTPSPTYTPRPVNTPKLRVCRVNTPKSTSVPVSVNTPKPTSVPVSVNTPKPTSVPVSVGTGIALEQIQAPFEKLGFDFFKSSALDDNDRLIDYWVGESFDPLVRLEIYGSSNNLTKIEMAVGAPFDEVKGAYLGLFLSLVLPESEVEGGANWMIDNIDEALDGAEPEMKSGGLSISMWYMSVLNFLWVTVTGG